MGCSGGLASLADQEAQRRRGLAFVPGWVPAAAVAGRA
jgi:hypothetical protein